MTDVLATRPHPEQAYRACLGLLRLGHRYGPERLEAACARAAQLGAPRYRTVQNILATGLDRVPLDAAPTVSRVIPLHPHLRGAANAKKEVPMLFHATVDKMTAMHLTPMADAFQRQLGSPQFADLSFEERVPRPVAKTTVGGVIWSTGN